MIVANTIVINIKQFQYRQGWTSLEPETPPISPPQQNLLRVPTSAASKSSLSVTPIHQSYFARKLEDLRHPQPGPSSVKCEDLTPIKNIQVSLELGFFFSQKIIKSSIKTSIPIEDESVEGSISSMSRDEKLVMEMQIPFTGEVLQRDHITEY